MIIPMLCVTIFVILVVWFLLPRVARLMIHTPTAISIFVCLSMVQDRKSGSAGMPRPISYAVFCLKKKKEKEQEDITERDDKRKIDEKRGCKGCETRASQQLRNE